MLAPGALLILGLTAFVPSIGFDFVNWDDPAYVHFNPSIRGWWPSNLYGVATETVTRNYAPLTIFTFLLDYTWSGLSPAGYHATNVFLHCVNGLMVFVLARQLTGSGFVGWLTAALFLIHPVQIESVAWISSRKGLVSAGFMLAACIVRLHPDATTKSDGAYFAFLAAALLSKALAVVLPPIVLMYDVLVRRERVSDALVRQVIPGLMSLMLLLYTMNAQNSILGGVRSHMEFPLLHIAAIDVLILWRYIAMLAFPVNLSVLYDPPVTGIAAAVVAGLAGWIAVAMAVWRRRREQPLWLFGWLAFLLLLFPVLNFFRITTLMNDRYLYLPCLPIFAMAAAGLETLAEAVSRLTSVRRLRLLTAGVCTCLALGGCLSLTSGHLPVWRNAESLWNHAMTTVPHLAVVRIQLALALYDSGRVDQAIDVLRTAQQECRADAADQERIQQHLSDWSREMTRPSESPPRVSVRVVP